MIFYLAGILLLRQTGLLDVLAHKFDIYPLILAQKIQSYQDGKASKELQQYQSCLAKSRKMLHSLVKQDQETFYAASRLKSVGTKNLKNGL